MSNDVSYLSREGSDNRQPIAYRLREGRKPTVIFCGGFLSDMEGTKATHLDRLTDALGQSYVRFDYQGHGKTGGDFTDYTTSDWLDDTLAIIDQVAAEDIILVGSSMGGWVASLAAQKRPERLKGLLLLAPAIDFTEELMWHHFSDAEKTQLKSDGYIFFQEPGYPPYTVTYDLIVDGRSHLMMNEQIRFDCPVHILQGGQDKSVPAAFVEKVFDQIETEKAMHFEPAASHGFSRPEDLEVIDATLISLIDRA